MERDSLDRLLHLDDGIPGRSDGIQAAYAYSPEEWRAQVEQVAYKLAQAGEPFTVDDLRKHGAPEADKPQRWGSLMASLASARVIDFHSLALHREPSGAVSAVRVWTGGPAAHDREQAA